MKPKNPGLKLLFTCLLAALVLNVPKAQADMNDINNAGVSVSAGLLNAGQMQMIFASMFPFKDLTNVTVTISIQNNGQTIAQQVMANQNFQAYMVQTFPASIMIPITASGYCMVSVQAVDGWTGIPDMMAQNVVGFWVTPAPSASSLQPPGALAPVNKSPLPPVSATPPPTAMSAITGGGTVLTNSDGSLSHGGYVTTTMQAPQPAPTGGVYQGSQQLWLLYPNTFGVQSGSGGVTMAYQPGSITTNVDLDGIQNQVVSGYPEVILGSDVFGYHNGDQGPQFPIQLSRMQALYIDTQYTLNVDPWFNGNLDVLFDLWLEPYVGYRNGQIGSVEVEILPYFNFPPVGNYWGRYIKTIQMPVILNGQQTTMAFLEYDAQNQGSGGGIGPGSTVLFYPANGKGLTKAAIKFDAVPFLREAAKTAQVGENWYLPGIQMGTEFGNANKIHYSFEIDKLYLTQILKP